MTENPKDLERELEKDRAHLRETIERLEDRLNPGEVIDQVMRNIGGGGRGFAENLLRDLRDQPLPALLTTAGLAWLAAGPRDRHPHTERAEPITATPTELRNAHRYDRYQDVIGTTPRQTGEEDRAYRRRVLDRQAEALELRRDTDEDDNSFSRRVSDAAGKAKEGSAKFRDRIGEGAKRAGEGVSGAASSTASGIGGAASSTADGIADAAAYTGDRAKSAAASAQDFHNENPLVSGALGLAIGAFLGAALPLSDREYDGLKDVADEGLRRGAEGVRQAAQSAQDAARAAEREVRGQGGNVT